MLTSGVNKKMAARVLFHPFGACGVDGEGDLWYSLQVYWFRMVNG
jgi:hypothetical protein